MNEKPIKARFAPSPTGYMHVGNARTALFNALFVKHQNMPFLLRMEDTDKVRSEQQYVEALLEDLKWLGLNWQEGPFYQTQRQAIYDEFYKKLQQEGVAYPCFCSQQQLALNRKIQRAAGKPPRYSGTCCELTKEEVANKIAQGEKPTLRFRMPENHEIIFNDLVRGEQKFNSNDIGDFIIRRQDGTSPFMFCSVIDDALMNVTHVLRGEDHLTNTPRQLMILRTLNLPEPVYGHMSLIMGEDGSPLSKRNGSRSLRELREFGFLPLAIVNYLARLGHYYQNEQLMTLDELAKNFSLQALAHAPARFEFQQLLYWQKKSVACLADTEFYAWLDKNTHKIIPKQSQQLFIATIKANVVFPSEANKWAEIIFQELQYNEEQKAILKDVGPAFFEVVLKLVAKFNGEYRQIIPELQKNLSISGKKLFMPLRIALTGERQGPELEKIFKLLGPKLKTRLVNAANI